MVSKMLFIYLAHIRPIYNLIYRKIFETEYDSDQLWVISGCPSNSSDCRNIFTKIFHETSGTPLLFNQYRHVTQAFAEKHISQIVQPGNMISTLNSQIGHSEKTGFRHYAGSQLDHHSISRDEIQDFEKFSLNWHIFLGISDQEIPKKQLKKQFNK